MATESIEALVEGGRASAAPPLGPSLGPLKVNISQVVSEINKKTDAFKGMKVPIKVIVDTETKEFNIEVGTPPVSQLIKKELNLKKGASYPHIEKVGNISIEQLIKVAKMKQDSLFVNSLKSAVKCIAGSCNSQGILIEGKPVEEFNQELDQGKYDLIIKEEKTELSQEKQSQLNEQLKQMQEKLKAQAEKLKAQIAAEKAKEESKEAKPEEKEEAKPEEKEEAKPEKEKSQKEDKK